MILNTQAESKVSKIKMINGVTSVLCTELVSENIQLELGSEKLRFDQFFLNLHILLKFGIEGRSVILARLGNRGPVLRGSYFMERALYLLFGIG